MKKFLTAVLTISLLMSAIMSGCKKENTASTYSKIQSNKLPTVTVGVIEDISSVYMADMIDTNIEGKLKGNYVVKMYKDVDSAASAMKKGEIQICNFPLLDALTVSKDSEYIYRILNFGSIYNYAILSQSKVQLTDFENKDILVYSDTAAAWLKATLKKANVNCTVTISNDEKEIKSAADGTKYAAIVAAYPLAAEIENLSKYKESVSLSDEAKNTKLTDNMYTSATVVSYDLTLVNDYAVDMFTKEFNASAALKSDKGYLSENFFSRGLNTSLKNAELSVKNCRSLFSEPKDASGDLKDIFSAVGDEYKTDLKTEKLTVK